MNQSYPSKQIYGFDVLKMVMALLIVAIHAQPFENAPFLKSYFAPLLDAAVPVFFILSSFFLFRKLNANGYKWDTLLIWCKRIGILYLFWLVVNLPIVVHERLQWGNETLPKLIWYVFRDLFFSHTFAGSWFLSALLFGVVGAFLIKKYFKSNIILLFFAVIVELFLYFRGVLPACSNDIYLWLTCHIREELELTPLMGILWCNIGCILASEHSINFCNYIKSEWIGLITIPLLIILFYILLLSGDHVYSLYKIGLVISIFLGGYCIKLPESSIYKTLRNYSILFFFQHFIWLRIYAFSFASRINGGCKYLIIIILCTIGSAVIIKLSRRKCFKWLKYSY